MPATPRSRARLRAVTGLLALGLAACGGGESVAPEDVDADVVVRGTDALTFEPSQLEADAGTISIGLISEGSLIHDVVIAETDTQVVEARGGAEVGTVELEAGTYTFYCSVPGHRTAGMEGTLEVS